MQLVFLILIVVFLMAGISFIRDAIDNYFCQCNFIGEVIIGIFFIIVAIGFICGEIGLIGLEKMEVLKNDILRERA